MKIGSLFTGYSGLDSAVAAASGAQTAWVSDVEDGPCRLLAHHFPDTPNIGDVTKVNWANVEPVDIITGGSPCQDISMAGRRKGMFDGTQSNLWVAMRGAIGALRPGYVVWENVRGALSARAHSDMGWTEGLVDERPSERVPAQEKDHALRALGRVLGDLADLGYDASWITVPASAVGAPHRRDRIFVVAWDPATADPRSLGSGGRAAQPGTAGGDDAAVGSDAGGSVGRDDRSLTLLPTPEAKLGKSGADYSRSARGSGGDDLTTTIVGRHGTDFGPYAPAIERWENILGRKAPTPTRISERSGKPQLTGEFTEWMMGLPEGWVTSPELGLTRAKQLRLLGNGVVPQQALHALTTLTQEEYT